MRHLKTSMMPARKKRRWRSGSEAGKPGWSRKKIPTGQI